MLAGSASGAPGTSISAKRVEVTTSHQSPWEKAQEEYLQQLGTQQSVKRWMQHLITALWDVMDVL